MILTEPLTLDTLLITVDGPLNRTVTQELRLAVLRGLAFRTYQFVFDFRDLTSIDSQGIEMLRIIANDVRETGGTWEILNPTDPIKDRLEQCDIPSLAPIRYAKLATWPGSLID